jgi:hypothetical protein
MAGIVFLKTDHISYLSSLFIMAPPKKTNRNPAFWLVLLAGYFVLFATQFNYRYYTVANFFVYGSSAVASANHPAAGSPLQKTSRPIEYHNNSHGLPHLSLDKRFRFSSAFNPVFICSIPRASFRFIKRKFYTPVPVYTSSLLPTNALRGPPCA